MAKKRFIDQLREAVRRCGKSRYRIWNETNIPQSTLSRFVNDLSVGLSLPAIDKLCECIGVEYVLRTKQPKRSTKKPKRK